MIFGLYFLQVVSLSAQTVPAFRHVRLDHTNGLRHDDNNVFLGSDDEGYLWIGSDGGAYRFDGEKLNRFFVGDPNFSDAVRSNFILDQTGSIWYGTPSGLVSIEAETGKLNHFPLGDSLSAQFGYHLIGKDRDTKSWLASNGSHLLGIDEDFSSPPQQLCSSKGVRHLLFAHSDSLLGLSFPWLLQRGVERVARNSKTEEISITKSTDKVIRRAMVNGGVLIDDKTAFLTSNKGLLSFDFTKDSCHIIPLPPYINSSKVWDVMVYDSLLLVATENDGLWWFNPVKNGFWRKLNSSKNGLTEKPRALHKSKSGQIIVSREEGGVDILVPQRFSIQSLLDYESSDERSPSILTDDMGACWILTAEGKLYRFQKDNLQLTCDLEFNDTDKPPPIMKVEALSGQLAIAHLKTIQFIDRISGTPTGRTIKLPANVRRLCVLDSTLIVETDNGFHHLEGDRIAPFEFSPLSNASLMDFHPMGGNELALYSGGAKVLLASFKSSRLVVNDSVPINGELLSISRNHKNRQLYLGTSQGFLSATQTIAKGWQTDSLLLNNVPVHKIITNDLEQVWVATALGLGLLDNDGWAWLTREHGLPNEQIQEDGIVVLNDGRVLVSSNKGVSIIEDKNGYPKSQSRIVLNQFWLNGNPLPAHLALDSTPLTLQQNDQNLQFQFSTLGIYDKEAARINYSISGLDGAWQTLGEDRMLKLTPLPVGEHTLLIKAQAADHSTTEILRIPLVVKVPYWETKWFRLLLLLTLPVLVGFVSFVVYRRKLHVAHQEHERQLLISSERDRIARDLHDDLGTDLSTILFLADDDGLSSESDRAEVTRLSRTALSKMREIVWTLSDQALDNSGLIAELIQHAQKQCAHHDISFQTNGKTFSSESNLKLSRSGRRELLLLMREAIENSIRHGKPSEIQLNVSTEDDQSFTIELIDNGCGFDLSLAPEGLGLSNLRLRAKRLSAHLEINSTPGNGTSVKLRTHLSKT